MKYFIIGIIIVLLIFGVWFLSFNKRVQIADIENFSFNYSRGYMMNAYIRYNVSCEEKCTATIKPYGIAEEDAYTLDVSDEVLKQIKDVLSKYDVNKWNGFQKSNKNVLDGDSFGLYVRMKSGDTIEASGYMMWPKNYSDVRDELDLIFNKLLKDNGISINDY